MKCELFIAWYIASTIDIEYAFYYLNRNGTVQSVKAAAIDRIGKLHTWTITKFLNSNSNYLGNSVNIIQFLNFKALHDSY